MRCFLILIAVFSVFNCKSQIHFEDVDVRSKQSILELYTYLAAHKTDTARLVDTTGNRFMFYDAVVNNFFDRAEMQKQFVKFGYNAYLQYEILRGMDVQIDAVKADSILVISGRSYLKKYKQEVARDLDQPNHFIAGFLQPGGLFPALDIKLNNKGKFVYAVPILHFE